MHTNARIGAGALPRARDRRIYAPRGLPLVARIGLSITAILFLCVGGGTLLVHQVVTDKFSGIESELVLRNRAVVQEVLNGELEYLQFTVNDWGHWDDLHDYAGGRNPSFADVELGTRGVQRLNLDVLLVLDGAGAVKAADFSPGLRAASSGSDEVLKRILAGLKGSGPERSALPGAPVKGFLDTPAGTLALAAQPIRRTAATGEPSGRLVMARLVDPKRLTSELSVMPAQVSLLRGADVTPDLHALAMSLSQQGQSARLVVREDGISDYQLFRDLNGRPAFLLESRVTGGLREIGRETTMLIAAINLFATGLVLITLVSVLRQLVVQPLTRLARYIENLQGDGADGPVPGADKGDEIGVLAQEFDSMFRARRADAAAMARLAAAVEHAGDSIAIMDRTGHIVYVNPQYERQTGCLAAEVVGRGPTRGRSAPEVYADLWTTVDRGDTWHGLLESDRKSGTRLIEDVLLTPLRGGDGEITGYVAVMRDVTATHDAEIEIRKLAAAVENSADAIVVMSPNGVIEYCNPAYERQRGLPLSGLYGRHPREVGRGLDSLDHYKSIWDCVSGGNSWSGEINTELLDGSRLVEEVVVSPIRSKAGTITHYVAVLHDATDRRSLEAELAQARRLEAVGQLAAGVAHEINTPIQYVGDNIRFLRESFGCLATLLDTLMGLARDRADAAALAAELTAALEGADVAYLRQEVPQAIDQSLEGVERVAEIVRSMKELAHPARDLVPVDLNRVVASAITVASPEWKAAAALVTDLDDSLPPVPCLPGAINQVVVNIIVNAAQAITERRSDPVPGQISVATRVRNGYAEIEVRDNGIGMSDDVRERIFDPFFTTKPVGKGTGQGLPIAHAVVKKHRGEIVVTSRPGAGTTFTVRLPLSAPVTAELAA